MRTEGARLDITLHSVKKNGLRLKKVNPVCRSTTYNTRIPERISKFQLYVDSSVIGGSQDTLENDIVRCFMESSDI